MARKRNLPGGKPPSQRKHRHKNPNIERLVPVDIPHIAMHGAGHAAALIERHDPNDIRHIAVHEAGHAVAALVLGIPFKGVDIKPRTDKHGHAIVGHTSTAPLTSDVIAGKGEGPAMPQLIVSLAGPMAEGLVNERCGEGGSIEGDRADWGRIAAAAVWNPSLSDEQNTRLVESFFNRAKEAAARFVAEHLQTIIDVANALLRKGELTQAEVAAIVEAGRATAS